MQAPEYESKKPQAVREKETQKVGRFEMSFGACAAPC